MSGRLIILPKKSYCPWKPENVERVLRDERLERERVEREEASLRQQESNRRLATLKGMRSADAATAANEHVNLFELEEQNQNTFVQTALTGEKEKKKQEVMPVCFGSVVKKQDQPFYVRPSKARNDDRCKARMDPMKAFVRPEHEKNDRDAEDPDDEDRNSSLQRSHHRKRSSRNEISDSEDMTSRRRLDKKHKKRKSNKKDENIDYIEELRERRRERERTESKREAALRADSRNDRHRRYQDQFHPRLSRR